MRIEICGGIAAGKTTLARQCQNCGYAAAYEDFDKNPFLEVFYRQPQKYAFETELTVTLQHYHLIKKTPVTSGDCLFTDYSIEQDYAYADSNLNASELRVFKTLYGEIRAQVEMPALIIYLKCPADVLLERISARNRKMEAAVDARYLSATIASIEKRIYNLKNTRIIELESSKSDFRNPVVFREFFEDKLLSVIGKTS